ncbi:D-2-hydroxyacid dehydrogenase [uncultured Enterovirga sp.]|uniref:D-2-hydroxyacid dehydrogenase n=1 Tax=uncultured Enterovirga sp. TaxID=2026352 RepID=UPI0035CA768F
MLPSRDSLIIGFAHPAYQMKSCFDALGTGITCFQVGSKQELADRAHEADVISVSGLWDNELLQRAGKLRFIQSISAGTNQYDREAIAARGIRLASAQGANARAVSQHAMALVLAIARRLPEAHDNQVRKLWRPMQGDFALREDELTDKTMLIVGLGTIGGRLASLAKAFDMKVVGTRRDPAAGANGADSVHGMGDLGGLLPEADYVVLTCPLTSETQDLIGRAELERMKPTAHLVNVARGGCVVEADLIEALQSGRIGGAALDTVVDEPLPASSPLWTLPNVVITSHLAGETRRYEENVLAILMDNLDRLWRGETTLRNQIV